MRCGVIRIFEIFVILQTLQVYSPSLSASGPADTGSTHLRCRLQVLQTLDLLTIAVGFRSCRHWIYSPSLSASGPSDTGSTHLRRRFQVLQTLGLFQADFERSVGVLARQPLVQAATLQQCVSADVVEVLALLDAQVFGRVVQTGPRDHLHVPLKMLREAQSDDLLLQLMVKHVRYLLHANNLKTWEWKDMRYWVTYVPIYE